MLANIFEITLDPLLTPDQIKNQAKPNSDMQFRLVYSDYQNLNKRSSYNKENLYPFPEFSQFISKKQKEQILSNRLHVLNTQYATKFAKKQSIVPSMAPAAQPEVQQKDKDSIMLGKLKSNTKTHNSPNSSVMMHHTIIETQEENIDGHEKPSTLRERDMKKPNF